MNLYFKTYLLKLCSYWLKWLKAFQINKPFLFMFGCLNMPALDLGLNKEFIQWHDWRLAPISSANALAYLSPHTRAHILSHCKKYIYGSSMGIYSLLLFCYGVSYPSTLKYKKKNNELNSTAETVEYHINFTKRLIYIVVFNLIVLYIRRKLIQNLIQNQFL